MEAEAEDPEELVKASEVLRLFPDSSVITPFLFLEPFESSLSLFSIFACFTCIFSACRKSNEHVAQL
jgi:hypothetical protein